mmetsp:Transcript_25591/g.61671  ORF Transcript_25591/g.61671 Transcript_25591/m.61671 type:complete len:158 (-) Transcript_25591:102-575(-)
MSAEGAAGAATLRVSYCGNIRVLVLIEGLEARSVSLLLKVALGAPEDVLGVWDPATRHVIPLEIVLQAPLAFQGVYGIVLAKSGQQPLENGEQKGMVGIGYGDVHNGRPANRGDEKQLLGGVRLGITADCRARSAEAIGLRPATRRAVPHPKGLQGF